MDQPGTESTRKIRSPYLDPATYYFFALLILILVAMTWIGLSLTEENRSVAWLAILVLMAAAIIVVGRAVTGFWRGVLIDARNKLCLSRPQILAWTVLVLSALLAAALSNVRQRSPSPLEIVVPSQLWIVMGISMASLVSAPAILGTKRDKEPAPAAVQRTQAELQKQGQPDAQTGPIATLMEIS